MVSQLARGPRRLLTLRCVRGAPRARSVGGDRQAWASGGRAPGGNRVTQAACRKIGTDLQAFKVFFMITRRCKFCLRMTFPGPWPVLSCPRLSHLVIRVPSLQRAAVPPHAGPSPRGFAPWGAAWDPRPGTASGAPQLRAFPPGRRVCEEGDPLGDCESWHQGP